MNIYLFNYRGVSHSQGELVYGNFDIISAPFLGNFDIISSPFLCISLLRISQLRATPAQLDQTKTKKEEEDVEE